MVCIARETTFHKIVLKTVISFENCNLIKHEFPHIFFGGQDKDIIPGLIGFFFYYYLQAVSGESR